MRIGLHPKALDELVEAGSYYESNESGLGFTFFAEVFRTASLIAKTPELFACVEGKKRRAPVKHFPYGLYYRIEVDEVFILVIKHDSRHPDYGMDRE